MLYSILKCEDQSFLSSFLKPCSMAHTTAMLVVTRLVQSLTPLRHVQTCHKQYKTAAELETHLSSYDHHHKKASFPVAACPVGA